MRNRMIILSFLVVMSLFLHPATQAQSSATPSDDEQRIILPEADIIALTGDILIAGSSTVEPLTRAIADRFVEDGFLGDIVIDMIGTGAGFERFCVGGETDISNASRAIRPSELALCQGINREPLEFRVGTDALAVVVSSQNDFVTSVSSEELRLIFGRAETWADVRPEWPAEPVLRFIPGTDSGTFDYFVEAVFDDDETNILAASNNRYSEDDTVLVVGIQDNPYAIGFFGFAYYQENTANLRALIIDDIEPTAATAEDGTYPLARPLFIYSTASILQSKPQVAAFINYYLTNVQSIILEVGYFPASQFALDVARLRWLVAMDLESAETLDAFIAQNNPAEIEPEATPDADDAGG